MQLYAIKLGGLMNVTWQNIIVIIERMFELNQEKIAAYLGSKPYTISRIANGETKKLTFISHDDIYERIFAPNIVQSFLTSSLNERELFDSLKDILKTLKLHDFLGDMIANENEYTNGDYKTWVIKLFRAADANVPARKKKSTPISLSSDLPTKLNSIIGRQTEFKRIDNILEIYNYALLYGFGGVGKSCTVLEYVYSKKQDYVIQYIICDETDSLQSALKKIKFNGLKDINIEFEKTIESLQNCQTPAIIIFDNLNKQFTIDEYEKFIKLTRCNHLIKFIITSRDNKLLREDYNEYTVEIKPLDNSTLLQLYNIWNKDSTKNTNIEKHREILTKIFQLVGYNTLAIELIACIPTKSGMNEYDIYNQLIKEGLDISVELSKNKDGKLIEGSPIVIIEKIFKIADLDYVQKNIMKHMALISLNGIKLRVFKELFEYNTDSEIFRLSDINWLVIKDEEDKIISLHPLIAEILWRMEDTKPSDAECHLFIKKLLNKLNNPEPDENMKFEFLNAAITLIQKITPEMEVIYNDTSIFNFFIYISENFENNSIQHDICTLIFHVAFKNLNHENNINFETFFHYMEFINSLHKEHTSIFQYHENFFKIIRESDEFEWQSNIDYLKNIHAMSNSEFDRYIEDFNNAQYDFNLKNQTILNIIIFLRNYNNKEFDLYIQFVNLLSKCDDSIFEFYIAFCLYLRHFNSCPISNEM